MLAKKFFLLLAKAVAVYVLVFVVWIFISPLYLRLIAFASAKLLPLVLVDDYRVESYQLRGRMNHPEAKKDQLRYYIQVSPQVRNWVQFGANDLTYPIVTFLTLALVTPNLTWKKRGKVVGIGFLVLWLFYSLLAVFFFRITSYADGLQLANLGLVEDIFGIRRLAAWKQGGGIAILTGQFVPVAIWFALSLGPLFFRSKSTRPPTQKP